jgi:cation diffusion facilitator CzcD-associated flavoprotein CzcO
MKEYHCVIVGTGFSGICAAIKLQQAGYPDFLMLERDAELGCTWWKNTYPGAAVDVVSRLYSFSFEDYDWSRLYALQAEILDYTNRIIDKYDLRSKARTAITIQSARYLEDEGKWLIELQDQEPLKTRFLINATGGLSQAQLPDIPGIADFQGKTCHTAQWDHSTDYTNRVVGVIGTGASAVQVVPELAKKARRVLVFQRTAHWILPRPDRVLSRIERWLLSWKIVHRMVRLRHYVGNELRVLLLSKFPSLLFIFSRMASRHLRRQVPDAQLRHQLTPNFTIGCKRVLVSSDYYPALCSDNVTLVTQPISHIAPQGVVLDNQQQLPVDVLVLATGFDATGKVVPYPVAGRDGKKLSDYWGDTPHAYCGSTVPGFPNFLLLMGPNTGTGHTSVIYFIESSVRYLVDAIDRASRGQWKSFEVREDVEREYNRWLQKKLKRTVWQVGGCKSWYLNKQGINTTLYPDFSFIFRYHTRKFQEKLHKIE